MQALLLSALLLPTAFALPSGPEDARSEYRRLTKEYAEAQKNYESELERVRETLGAQELAEYEADWNPNHGYVEAFGEFARTFAGTGDAVMFLEWIVKYSLMNGKKLSEASNRALTTLLDEHRDHAGFRSTVANAGYLSYQLSSRRVLAILERVIDYGDEELTLSAYFSRGVTRAGRDAAPEELELAKADFNRVRKLAPNSPLAKTAAGYLFELENLQVGMLAPDIEGPDLDGVSFRLSDYRGKVVFLDFWGDW